jgi:Ca2+-binding RTX toxin-like protein
VDAADFAGGFLPSGFANFAPGETSQVITVTLGGDSGFEADEGFVVTLDNPIGEVIAVTSTAGGTVLNDDTTAVVGIVALAADKPEGVEGTTNFFFELTRGGGMSGSAVIAWLAEPFGIRPADAADFVGGSFPVGSVTFAPGETSKTIAVPVAGDVLREGHEEFQVSLIGLSGADLSTPFAQGTIRADEAIEDIIVVDAATGLALPATPSFYSGPVAGLERELLAIVAQNVTAIANGPGWFIHSGAGDDALRALMGRNVLDGGTGSNFLTGGSGADSFFLDARGQTVPIWSTLVDFALGDDATVWGIAAATSTLIWQENAGADGFTGLTLHAARPGVDFASLTLAGYTRADLDGGRLVAGFGFDAGSGSDYLYLRLA